MVSRTELMEEAKKLKIKGRSTMKKAELEEAIKRAKEGDDDMPQFLKDAEADLARTSPSPMARKGAPKRGGAAPLKQRPGRY